jgi:hypothetical protein
VIAVSGVVGTLNVLVAPSEVFGLRSFGLRAADALFNLAGGVLGVAAAWAVASASADDVALDA